MKVFMPRGLRFVLPLLLLVIASSFVTALVAEDNDGISPGEREAAVNEADSLALVALYNETNRRGWTNDTNWLTGPVDTWYGVTVTEGRVTRLELAGNGLEYNRSTGRSIPPEIGDLLHLQVLDLQSNQLIGAVPAEIANLTNLEQLHLNDNDLEDLPDLSALGKVSAVDALTTLSVENNRLTFEDIEPNVGLAPTFTYAPQARVGGEQYQKVSEGDSVELHIPVGGTNNQYQWYKDGVALAGATRDRYTIVNMTVFDEGSYELEITNTLATDLTLWSSPRRYSFNRSQWLDIGAYHHAYVESGARPELGSEVADMPAGMEYPAILRHSGHIRAKAFWIGVKDWTDPQGQHYPYYVARIGPHRSGFDVTFPTQNKLIGRYEDTLVEVDGAPSFDNEAVLDEIDPGLAADRMIHHIHNMAVGITTNRKIYAYTNPYHDNYHIIEYAYCNTGNTDGDAAIELPNQTLHDVYFFRIHRWRGNAQAAWVTGAGQVWGKYSMVDIVGDGHEEYNVDFTAIYLWYGINWAFSQYDTIGGAIFEDSNNRVAPGDSVGRLSGPTMVGRSTIHADNAPTDKTYDPTVQPHTIGWIDGDEDLNWDMASHEDYYELGILTRENPERNPGCAWCSSRMYPHYADRIEPSGTFWDQQADPAFGRDGGFGPTTAYGPYEMAPGECVNVVVSEGIAGLSFDAATKIGRAYKRGGAGREAKIIEYDANGDGVIDTTPFDYDNIFVGTEAQTKNQWVMSARDSLFQMFYRARDLYTASNNMTTYPIPEPPRAPVRFSLWGRPAGIDLEWTPALDGPTVDHWELYRTDRWEDNLYVNGCLDDLSIACGYEQVASLPAETTAYTDTDVLPGIDYFYYIEGLGQPQPVDPRAITGTPYGLPLRSSRYLTQTYTPVALQTSTSVTEEAVPERFVLEGNYPNPFNAATTIRYALPAAADVELVIYDVMGRKVAVVVRQRQGAGRYEEVFEASELASGVYVYVLRAGAQRAQRTMLLVK